MRVISVEQFHQECQAQGVPHSINVAFKCPVCKTIQCAADLIAASAGKNEEEVQKYLGFSCIGRFTHGKQGCDWTLGGLFKLHTLEIEMPDGKKHPHFELATPEEAQAHITQRSVRL